MVGILNESQGVEGPLGRSCDLGRRELLAKIMGMLNRERGKGSPPQPNLPAGASHWLKPDGSWQTKDPADKVFKVQDPGTWNKIQRGSKCIWSRLGWY